VVRWVAVAGVGLIVLGNVMLLGASLWARGASPPAFLSLPGVPNLVRVDDRLWRGAEPNDAGYRELAAGGVTTVVDLAAADGPDRDDALLAELGVLEVELPVTDGGIPSRGQVARFLEVVRSTPGRVFVHCRAGVGRTGTMAAAYLVAMGRTSATEALRRTLAVGPPSLEQVVFVARLDTDLDDRPPLIISVTSRLIDGPRRLWGFLRGAA
jgi:protein tyrosine phosphatase (PTP) superfamily phosphohydrolase (DUF442 family)